MIKKPVISWAVCLCFVLSVLPLSAGAANDPRFNVTSWTTDDGLPQNTVNAIVQSYDGYLWLATNNGLVRFDGARFVTYNTANLPGLRNNQIMSIQETADRKLWVTTHGGGLSVLNPQRSRAVVYTVKDGLATNFLRKSYKDNRDRIWARSAFSLQYFKDGRFHYLMRGGAPVKDLPSNILEDSRGNFWLGFKNKIFMVKGGFGGEWIEYSIKSESNENHYYGTFEDRESNTIWVSSFSHLIRYRDQRLKTIFVRKNLGLTTFAKDWAGNTWTGSAFEGFYRLEKPRKSGGDERLVLVDDERLKHLSISTVFVDREGTIWLGTARSGLVRLRESIIRVYSRDDGFKKTALLSIYQDSAGVIWASTNGGGVYYMKDGRFHHFHAIKDNFIWSIIEDREGNFWFGSYGGGLYRMNRDRITNFKEEDGLPCNIVVALFEDRNGVIWIGTVEGGVANYRNGKFTTFGKSHGFDPVTVTSFMEDSSGAIWIGTVASGLYRYKDRRFTRWHTGNGLSYDNIRAIYEESPGTFWIGTNGGGLNRLKNGKISVIQKENGLFDNVVSSILPDQNGNLWMTCNRGVYRIPISRLNAFADGRAHRVHSYYYNKDDGMHSAECNGGFQPAVCKTSDGKLWIPTIRGIAVFDPGKVNVNEVPPQVVIERMAVDGRNMVPRPGIEIDAGVKNIVLQFTALSYINPDRVRFKCKLEGFDEEWIDLGKRRTAYFTELSPGNYTFRVKACNNDGLWNEKGAALSFYKNPFFYQTWWFYLAVFMMVAAVGIMVFYLRVRALNRRKTELEEVVAQRTLELQAANQVARQEREAAEHANQSKGEFLARMSHEIRTPLNSVIGFSELLSATGLDHLQKEYITTIAHSGEALLDLIDDILDFSKIEAGMLSFDLVDFDPEVTAYDVCDFILPRIGSKPVEVLCRIGDTVPSYINQDPGRFRQVLVNLMTNAAKFTEKGEIQLSMDVEEKKKNTIKLHCTVRDTGVGIPPDKIDAIFDVFQQADGSVTRKFGGTGLGLAICKQIARHMDGDVTVESTPGYGSTFHFTSWVGKSDRVRTGSFSTIDLAGKSILVVDDNISNLAIVDHILTTFLVSVTKESDSRNVIPLLLDQKEQSDRFDLCIIDGNMPGLSGVQLAQLIRKLPPPICDTPLLAFTSIGTRQSKDMRDAGFDGFLPKPVQSKKLINMIKSILESDGQLKHESTGGAPGKKNMITQHSIRETVKHSVRILLVEDNVVNRKLAHFLLTQAGYAVDYSENGSDAVAKYTANPDGFDLIFMDIQMPGMDGREATRKIRGQGFTEIPIIAMTAESMKGDKEKCLEAGMNDYIAKPIRREIVFEMIKKWILE